MLRILKGRGCNRPLIDSVDAISLGRRQLDLNSSPDDVEKKGICDETVIR